MNGVQRFVRWLRGERAPHGYCYECGNVIVGCRKIIGRAPDNQYVCTDCGAKELLTDSRDGDDYEYVRNPDGTYGRSMVDDIGRFWSMEAQTGFDWPFQFEPRAGDAMTLPDGTTHTAREDYAGDVTFEPDD